QVSMNRSTWQGSLPSWALIVRPQNILPSAVAKPHPSLGSVEPWQPTYMTTRSFGVVLWRSQARPAVTPACVAFSAWTSRTWILRWKLLACSRKTLAISSPHQLYDARLWPLALSGVWFRVTPRTYRSPFLAGGSAVQAGWGRATRTSNRHQRRITDL